MDYTIESTLVNLLSNHPFPSVLLQEKGKPLPKFGDWDVNDPASAEGFTMIFNKARDEKKTGGTPESPTKMESNLMHGANPVKPQPVSYSLHYLFSVCS